MVSAGGLGIGSDSLDLRQAGGPLALVSDQVLSYGFADEMAETLSLSFRERLEGLVLPVVE